MEKNRDGEPAKPPFIDGLGAKLVALVVILLIGAILLLIHWEDLFPPPPPPPSEDPLERCIQERTQQIEQMIIDNPDLAGQKSMFIQRAAGFCQSQVQ